MDDTKNKQQLNNGLKAEESPQEEIDQALSAVGGQISPSKTPRPESNSISKSDPVPLKPAGDKPKPVEETTKPEVEPVKPVNVQSEIDASKTPGEVSTPAPKPELTTPPTDPLDVKNTPAALKVNRPIDAPATPPPPPPMPGESKTDNLKPDVPGSGSSDDPGTKDTILNSDGSGSGKPPQITQEEPQMGDPKRNFDRSKAAKIGGALLGLFLLVGGLVGANYLVQQRAEPRSQAAEDYDDATDYFSWCFWCAGKLDKKDSSPNGYCGWNSDHLYAISRQGDHDGDEVGPETEKDTCGYDKDASTIWNKVGAKCSSLQRDQDASGLIGGPAHPDRDNHDLTKCDDCIDIDTELTTEGLKVAAVGRSELPLVEYEGQPDNWKEWDYEKQKYHFGKSHIDWEASKLWFKFTLSTGQTQEVKASSCTSEYDSDGRWDIYGFRADELEIECTAEHTFPGITSTEDLTITAVVKNPVVSNDAYPSQASPACTITAQAQPQYVCVDPMVASPNPPVSGQPVDLTCQGAVQDATIDHFEFQQRLSGGDWEDLGSRPDSDGDNQETLTIDSAPEMPWETRCRVCISQDGRLCTPWHEPGTASCTGITQSPPGPASPGNTISFTCSHTEGEVHHYIWESRNSTLSTSWSSLPDSSQTINYTVPPETEGTSFEFRCQVCTSSTNCLAWESLCTTSVTIE